MWLSMNAINVTVNDGELVIALSGNLMVAAPTIADMAVAVAGKRARRTAARAKGRRNAVAVAPITRTVVCLSNVTALGMVGAALVRGAYTAAPYVAHMVCRAGSWAPTIRLITRCVITTV